MALVAAAFVGGACPGSPNALSFEAASAQAPIMVLEGEVDPAGPVAVVFDTGASAPFDLFISSSLAIRLGLSLSEEIAAPDSTAIGTSRQTYRTAHLGRFALGPIVLQGTEVAVVPMIDGMQAQVGRRIDAIVGHQLVHDRTISIDYAAKRIDLEAGNGEEGSAIPFVLAPRKPLMLVPVTIDGRGPFLMEIDTGATGTTLSVEAAKRAGVDAQGQGRLGGAGGQVAVQLGQARLEFGPIARTLGVAVSPAITAIATASGSPVDGILGGDFFADACLTIDYPRSRLWLSLQ
jgi:predicted aspartyl protease